MLFDTHAHYDDSQFDEDREETLLRIRENGVGYVLSASADIASSRKNIQIARKHAFVYTSVGVHPHTVSELEDNAIPVMKALAAEPKVVAVGEIGLDYYYDNSPRDLQKLWFSRQIAMAGELKLPIIVHDRDAHEDTISLLKAGNAANTGGVLHCFSGSVEMAREILKMGLFISIAGPVTFRNASRILDVVRYVPDDMLLIETDSPYLAPEPFRGKRNESTHVRLICEKIAAIRDREPEFIEEITTSNAKRLFGIK